MIFQSCGARIPQRRALVMWSSPAAVLPALSLEVTLFLSTSHQVCTFCRVCHLRKEEGSRQDESFQPDVGESSCPTGAGLTPALQKCIRSCSVDEIRGMHHPASVTMAEWILHCAASRKPRLCTSASPNQGWCLETTFEFLSVSLVVPSKSWPMI